MSKELKALTGRLDEEKSNSEKLNKKMKDEEK
jgi:hypothetical protein